jgi:hypothetical protein
VSLCVFRAASIYGQGTEFGVWSGASNRAGSFGDKNLHKVTMLPTYSIQQDNLLFRTEGTQFFPITAKNSTANFNDSNYDAVINNGQSLSNHVSVSGGSETLVSI